MQAAEKEYVDVYLDARGSEGHASIPLPDNAVARVAVAADTDVLTPPCGACRQILWEFCGDIELTLVNPRGKIETFRMKDLFPRPFDASFL